MRVIPLPAGLATTAPEAHGLRDQLADRLSIETAINAWGGRGHLRLSAQIYNDADDYDNLADKLPGFLRSL